MRDEILKHLYDVKDAALAIKRFIEGKTFDDYKKNALLQSGVERKFEIVDEALNRIKRDAPEMLDQIRNKTTGSPKQLGQVFILDRI